MKYLLFGISSSLLLLIVSCDKTTKIVDGPITINFIYENRLDVPIKIDYYWTNYGIHDPGSKSKTATIEVGKSLTEKVELMGSSEIILIGCDSVRMVFGDTKELWHYTTDEQSKKGSIFVLDNYTTDKVSETETNCTYEINQSVYDLATDRAIKYRVL